MNGHERRRLRKIENIKRAASELFKEHGIDKVSIDQIASRSGVCKATLYKYFESKEKLYEQVLKMVVDEEIIAMEIIVNSNMDFADKLKSVLLTRMDYVTSMTRFNQYMIGDNGEILYGHNARSRLMLELIDQGKENGFIDRRADSQYILQFFNCFFNGLSGPMCKSKVNTPARDGLVGMIDLCLYGIINRKDILSSPCKNSYQA